MYTSKWPDFHLIEWLIDWLIGLIDWQRITQCTLTENHLRLYQFCPLTIWIGGGGVDIDEDDGPQSLPPGLLYVTFESTIASLYNRQSSVFNGFVTHPSPSSPLSQSPTFVYDKWRIITSIQYKRQFSNNHQMYVYIIYSQLYDQFLFGLQ